MDSLVKPVSHNGSEKVLEWCRKHIPNFQECEETSRSVKASVLENKKKMLPTNE